MGSTETLSDFVDNYHVVNHLSTDDSQGDVVLVGSHHYSEDTPKLIQNAFSLSNPDIIAIELCENRFYGEQSHSVSPKYPTKVGTLLLGNFYNRLKQFLSFSQTEESGFDMQTAIDISIEQEIPLALIDRTVQTTLQRFVEEATHKELFEVVTGIRNKNGINLLQSGDILQEDLEKYKSQTKERYPAFSKVFTEERDKLLASNIDTLRSYNDTVLVVVGAAHMKGIIDHLHKFSNENNTVKSDYKTVKPW